MDRTLTHVCHTRPVERRKVHHPMTLLELPGFDFLTLAMRPELDFDRPGTEEGGGATRGVLLRAYFVTVYSPRFSEFIHVELELVVSAHSVVSFLTVVVTTQTAQTTAEVRGSYHLYETVAVPCDF